MVSLELVVDGLTNTAGMVPISLMRCSVLAEWKQNCRDLILLSGMGERDTRNDWVVLMLMREHRSHESEEE